MRSRVRGSGSSGIRPAGCAESLRQYRTVQRDDLEARAPTMMTQPTEPGGDCVAVVAHPGIRRTTTAEVEAEAVNGPPHRGVADAQCAEEVAIDRIAAESNRGRDNPCRGVGALAVIAAAGNGSAGAWPTSARCHSAMRWMRCSRSAATESRRNQRNDRNDGARGCIERVLDSPDGAGNAARPTSSARAQGNARARAWRRSASEARRVEAAHWKSCVRATPVCR
jgi:hypothetical protein